MHRNGPNFIKKMDQIKKHKESNLVSLLSPKF